MILMKSPDKRRDVSSDKNSKIKNNIALQTRTVCNNKKKGIKLVNN